MRQSGNKIHLMNTDIYKAVKILKQGGVVIFPTDTAFAIGCRIDNKKAIERLFKIRKRPKTQATPVLVDSLDMARDYLQSIGKEVIDKLIKPYWPGGLTVILPCKTFKVSELVRGGKDTLGVRMPNHPVPLNLIKGVGVPVLGPSANFHAEKTPFGLEDLNPALIKLADYIVPGNTSLMEKPSTVIDCSKEQWRVIREGVIELKI